jgi:hypothetical protein
VLVPALIAGVTLAARRWGPRVGGFLTALPVVAGPTLGFYIVEQGTAFAADAVRGTLLGLVGVAAFCLAYAHAATRLHWSVCLAIGWLSFGVVTWLAVGVEVGALAGVIMAVSALLGARALLPAASATMSNVAPPRWDLLLRVASAAGLVFALTSLADRLGPSMSGLLTPFPVATAIITSFTHAQHGSASSIAFLRGYIPGLCGFAVFCFVLAITLPTWDVVAAFATALATQLSLQVFVMRRGG